MFNFVYKYYFETMEKAEQAIEENELNNYYNISSKNW